jgi:hypothetical protein
LDELEIRKFDLEESLKKTGEKMVTFSEIQDAFFFVSSDEYGMNIAILCKDTGQIFYRSESGTIDEIDDEDELDCDEIIRIPHKNDLGLGRELVFEFAGRHLADEYQRVQQIFQSRGAHGRFKDLLKYRGLLQSWYDFENRREEEVLRRWCVDEEIELTGEQENSVDFMDSMDSMKSIDSSQSQLTQYAGDGKAKREPAQRAKTSETEWSKPEKEIARKAYRAAYNKETMAIAENVRKMAAEINEPSDLWKIHDYLSEKRKETDEKYDYRYSVLIWVFARLIYDGWIRLEDLEGLSDAKLQKIRGVAEL